MCQSFLVLVVFGVGRFGHDDFRDYRFRVDRVHTDADNVGNSVAVVTTVLLISISIVGGNGCKRCPLPGIYSSGMQ